LNAPTFKLPSAAGEEQLQAVRVGALYSVGRSVYLTSPLVAALTLVLLWELPGRGVLLSWFAAVIAVTLGRVALHRAYQRAANRPLGALAWERRFALGALAAGAAWAFPLVVMFPEGEPPQQFALLFVATGSLVGAGGVYASSALTFYAFCSLPLVAMAAQLLAQADRSYQLMGGVVLVFSVVMVRVFGDIQRNMLGALRARIDKEALLERVAQSEERLRDAIEGFPEGIAVFDEHDRLAVCNDEYARVYGAGLGAEQLVGAPARSIAEAAYEAEIVAPAPAGGRAGWIAERLARRRHAASVRQYQTRDGRWKQGHFVGTRRGGSVSVFIDISETKQAQAAYQAVLAEEHLVLEVLPAGVAFIDNRVIVRCNARLERMLGYAPGELAGRSARAFYPTEESWRAAGSMYEQLRDGGIFEGDGPLARKDGSRLWCRALARAVNPDAPQEAAIVVFSDITDRHAAELALRRSEALYRSLVETSNDLVWSIDLEGRWTYLNPAAVRRIYGCKATDLVATRMQDLPAPGLRERDAAVFARVLAGDAVFRHETRHRRRDGSLVDLSFNAVPLRDARGGIVGATGTARDITVERAAAAALHEGIEKLRLAVDAADLYYWEWDAGSDRLQWGREPTGRAGEAGPPDAAAQSMAQYRQRVHPKDLERYDAAGLAAARGEPYAVDVRLVGQDGAVHWTALRGKMMFDGSGQPVRMIGVSQDITGRKRREEQERFLAYHDTLTGLPNRRLLDDRLRQATNLALRRDARVAVMVIDLDDFKRVNDQLGHPAGDAVLREVAQRLAGCVRKADTLARQGGDEFVVVIPDLGQEADCQVVAEKVLRALQPAFLADGGEFQIGASIGISIFPGDAGDGEALLRNADAAMYRAKQLGRNNYRFYSR
jgi:diguanylate cyclase (GGDEF)-like protein/PAS domain S-box-containing protein